MNRTESSAAGATDSSAARTLFFVALAAAAVMLLLFAWPIADGRVYVADDLGTLHLPMRWFYAQCLHRGESFLWLPNLYCGNYAQGEGQAGMCHPFHALLYATLPLNWAFNIEWLHSYPVAFAGMFLFLRRRRLPLHAAAFGALAFAFCGYTTWHFMHLHVVEIVAQIPWLLFCAEVALRSENRKAAAAALLGAGLLTASQLLLGHPQHVWFSFVAEALYAASRVRSRAAARRLALLGLFTVGGIAAAGAQLLPSWDALSGSVRADPSLSFRNVGSMHPLNLAQVVTPHLFPRGAFLENATDMPHEFALYAGALLPAAVALLLIRRKELGELGSLALGGAALAALALALALGKYGGLYELQAAAPFIGLFRYPSRYIVLFHLAAAMLVAVALAELWNMARTGQRLEWRRLWPMAIAPAVSALAAVYVWSRLSGASDKFLSGQVAAFPEMLIGPAMVLAAALLMACAARGMRYAAVALLLFGAADLGFHGLSYIRERSPVTVEEFISRPVTPPDADRFRLYCGDWSNRLIMRGLRLLNGNAGLYPQKALAYTDTCQQLAGVRWRWADDLVDPRRSGWAPTRWPPLPRARMVSRAVVSDDLNRDIERTDVAEAALVASPLDLAGGIPGDVEIVKDQPGRIEMTASAPTRQLLVLSESYHSGWRAKVGNDVVPVVRVYGDFMGCVLEPGEHRIEFKFAPASFRYGVWMSLAGLAALLAGFALVYRGKRPAQNSGSGT